MRWEARPVEKNNGRVHTLVRRRADGGPAHAIQRAMVEPHLAERCLQLLERNRRQIVGRLAHSRAFAGYSRSMLVHHEQADGRAGHGESPEGCDLPGSHDGRGDWTRTSDLLNPIQVRYQNCATPRRRAESTRPWQDPPK